MAYFSTWRLHENRVSKTRFISLINKIKSERNHQNIIEEPRGKKKKNPRNRKGEKIEIRDRSWWLQTTVRDPGLGLARLVAPGCASPKSRATQAWGSRAGLPRLGAHVLGSPRPGARAPGRPRWREPQAWGSRAWVAAAWGSRAWVVATWVCLGRRGLSLSPSDLSLSLPLISLSLWSESLGLGLMFFSCICFWVFRPYMRLQIFLNFFGLEIES